MTIKYRFKLISIFPKVFSLLAIIGMFACKPTQKAHTNTADQDGLSRSENIQTAAMSNNLFLHPSENASTHILSKNGKPLYDILIAENANPAEAHSAEVLKLHLQKICNCSFPIVRNQSNRPYISIGATRPARAIGRLDSKLGEEGYEIHTRNRNLYFLADGPIGIVNASLAFLEEDLGIRWWGKQKTETHYPKSPNLSVTLASRSSKPAFEYREPFFNAIQSKNYYNHNRLRPSRGSGDIPKFSWQPYKQYPVGYETHTFREFVPGSEFAQNHPEYYSEKNGKRKLPTKNNYGTQLCLSNHEVASIVSRRAKKVLDKSPTATKIHISQNDGGGLFCDCDRCTQINQKEGSRSGSLIYFINRVADDLKKSHPDVKVVTFAYKETAKPPKNIRPRDNVIIELCTDSHWATPLIPIEEDRNFVSMVDGWNRLGANLYIWDYGVDFSHYISPLPNLDVMARNFRFYQRKGVQGVIVQGPYQGQNQGSDRALLKAWVWGKLMWNPKMDAQALALEFNRAMYQNAAKPLNQYNALMQRSWEQYHKKGKPSAAFLPADFMASSLKYVKEARALTSDETLLKYIGYWEASVLYSRLRLGPKSESDIKAFNKDLDRFQVICKQYDIRRLREQMLQGGNIDRFVSDSKIAAENTRLKPTGDKIQFHEQGFYRPAVWGEDISPKITKDPLAANNYAMGLSSSVSGWRMNLYIPADYKGEKEYKLNVAIRVDWKKTKLSAADKAKKILKVIAYDEKTSGVLLKRFLYYNDLKSNSYTHFEIGSFSPKAKDRIVITPMDTEIIDHFYVDYIELDPK